MLIARSFPSTTSTRIWPRYARPSVSDPPAPGEKVSGAVSGWSAPPSTGSRRLVPRLNVPAASVCAVPLPSVTVNGTVDEIFTVFCLSASSTRIEVVAVLPSFVPG